MQSELWLLAFVCVFVSQVWISACWLIEPSGATADKAFSGGRVVDQRKQEAGGTTGMVGVRRSHRSWSFFTTVICRFVT